MIQLKEPEFVFEIQSSRSESSKTRGVGSEYYNSRLCSIHCYNNNNNNNKVCFMKQVHIAIHTSFYVLKFKGIYIEEDYLF